MTDNYPTANHVVPHMSNTLQNVGKFLGADQGITWCPSSASGQSISILDDWDLEREKEERMVRWEKREGFNLNRSTHFWTARMR